MCSLKVCFIGVGSIAKRHMKNLVEICSDNGMELTMDVCRSGFGNPLPDDVEKSVHMKYSLQDMPDDYDAIFITNPTKCHYETLRATAGKARSYFIEKPVFDTAEADVGALGLNGDAVCYVACPMRYMGIISYLKANIDFSQVYSLRAISSSYLPEWREGVDYRDTYSARKELGGGVATDLIHEWDYITYLIGLPQKSYQIIGRYSNLQIDSDDLAIYIAQYPTLCVELHLDYYGRKPLRRLELYMEDDTVVADILSGRITWLKSGKVLDFAEERDAFQKRELENFLKMMDGEAVNENDISYAVEVLRLAQGGLA